MRAGCAPGCVALGEAREWGAGTISGGRKREPRSPVPEAVREAVREALRQAMGGLGTPPSSQWGGRLDVRGGGECSVGRA